MTATWKKDRQKDFKSILRMDRNKEYEIQVSNGKEMQTIKLDVDNYSIEEIVFICVKTGKGMWKTVTEMKECLQKGIVKLNTNKEIDGWKFIDMECAGLESGYFFIKDMITNNVTIHYMD
ncbi:hypothetical protein [[Eubacterium] hominis]|uniref:hypothetical protein n=1 Tax=[Eubacterium] hominis TaxID=2764325 RepID=UPI0020480537|nr:MAG TPA: hypothetical protein [Caudoviricetes sp.]